MLETLLREAVSMATRGVLRPLAAEDVSWSPWKGEAVLQKLQLAREADSTSWCWEGWEVMDGHVGSLKVHVPWKTPWKDVLVHVKAVHVRVRRCVQPPPEEKETQLDSTTTSKEQQEDEECTKEGKDARESEEMGTEGSDNVEGTSKGRKMAQRMAEALLQRLHVVVEDLKVTIEGERQCLTMQFQKAEAQARSGSIKQVELCHGSTSITVEPVDIHASVGQADAIGDGITPVRLRTTPILLKVDPELVHTMQNLLDDGTPHKQEEDSTSTAASDMTEGPRSTQGLGTEKALHKFRKAAKQIIVAAAVAQATSLVKDEDDAERFFDALSDNLGEIVARGKMVDFNGRVDTFRLIFDAEERQCSVTLSFTHSRVRIAVRKQPPLRIKWKIGGIQASTPEVQETGVDGLAAKFSSPGELLMTTLDSSTNDPIAHALELRMDWTSTIGPVACATGTVGKIEGNISFFHISQCVEAFSKKIHRVEENKGSPIAEDVEATAIHHSRILQLAEQGAMSTNASASVRLELSGACVNLSRQCNPQDVVTISIERLTAKSSELPPVRKKDVFQREKEILSQALALQNNRMITRALREIDRAILSANWQLRLDEICYAGKGAKSPTASFRKLQLEVMLGETVTFLSALELTSVDFIMDVGSMVELASAGASGLDIVFGDCFQGCSLQKIGIDRVRLDGSQQKSGEIAVDLHTSGWSGSFLCGNPLDPQRLPSLLLKWKQEKASGGTVGISMRNFFLHLPEEVVEAVTSIKPSDSEHNSAANHPIATEEVTSAGGEVGLRKVQVLGDNVGIRLTVSSGITGPQGAELVFKKLLVSVEPNIDMMISVTHGKIGIPTCHARGYLDSCITLEAGLLRYNNHQVDLKMDSLMAHILANESLPIISLVEAFNLAFQKIQSNEESNVQMECQHHSQNCTERGGEASSQSHKVAQGPSKWVVCMKHCSLKSWCGTFDGEPVCLFLDGLTFKQERSCTEIAFIGLGLSEASVLGALVCPCGPITLEHRDPGIASTFETPLSAGSLVDLSGMKLQIDLAKFSNILVHMQLASNLWANAAKELRQGKFRGWKRTVAAEPKLPTSELPQSKGADSLADPRRQSSMYEIQASCSTSAWAPAHPQHSHLNLPATLQQDSRLSSLEGTHANWFPSLRLPLNGKANQERVWNDLPEDGFLPKDAFPWNQKHKDASSSSQRQYHHLTLRWAIVELFLQDSGTSMLCIQGLDASSASDGSVAVSVDDIAAAFQRAGSLSREEMSHYKAEHPTPPLPSPYTPTEGAVGTSTRSSLARTSLDTGSQETRSMSRRDAAECSPSVEGWLFGTAVSHPVTKILRSIERRNINSPTSHTLHWNKVNEAWTTWNPDEELVHLSTLRVKYCKESAKAINLQVAADTLLFHVSPGKIDAVHDNLSAVQSSIDHFYSTYSAGCAANKSVALSGWDCASTEDTVAQPYNAIEAQEPPMVRSEDSCRDCIEPQNVDGRTKRTQSQERTDEVAQACSWFMQMQVCRGFASFGSRTMAHVEAGLCPISVAAFFSDGDLELTSSVTVAADVRESQIGPWEPLVVPWNFSIRVQASSGEERNCEASSGSSGSQENNALEHVSILFHSNNSLDICCSSTAMRLIRTDAWWKEADQEALAWLVNGTGEDVTVWIPQVPTYSDTVQTMSGRSYSSGKRPVNLSKKSSNRVVKRLFDGTNSQSSLVGCDPGDLSKASSPQVVESQDKEALQFEQQSDPPHTGDEQTIQIPSYLEHQPFVGAKDAAPLNQASGDEEVQWSAPVVLKTNQRVALPNSFATGPPLVCPAAFPKSACTWVQGTDQECSYPVQGISKICIGIGTMVAPVSVQGPRADIGLCKADPALSRVGSSLHIHSPLRLSNHGCTPLMVSHVPHAFIEPVPFILLEPGGSVWAPLSICLQGGYLRICPSNTGNERIWKGDKNLDDIQPWDSELSGGAFRLSSAEDESQREDEASSSAWRKEAIFESKCMKSQRSPAAAATHGSQPSSQNSEYSWSNLITVEDILHGAGLSTDSATAICPPLIDDHTTSRKSLHWKVLLRSEPSSMRPEETSEQDSTPVEDHKAFEMNLKHDQCASSTSFRGSSPSLGDLYNLQVASLESSQSGRAAFSSQVKESPTGKSEHTVWREVNVVFLPSLVVESDLPSSIEIIMEDVAVRTHSPSSEQKHEPFFLPPLGCLKTQAFNLQTTFLMSVKPVGYRWSKPIQLAPEVSRSTASRFLKSRSSRKQNVLLYPVESSCGASWPLELVIETVPGGIHGSSRISIRASVVLTNETECTFIFHDHLAGSYRKLTHAQQHCAGESSVLHECSRGLTETSDSSAGVQRPKRGIPNQGKLHVTEGNSLPSSTGSQHPSNDEDAVSCPSGTWPTSELLNHDQCLVQSLSLSELGVSLHGMAWQQNLPLAFSIQAIKSRDGEEGQQNVSDESYHGYVRRSHMNSDVDDCSVWSEKATLDHKTMLAATLSVPICSVQYPSPGYNRIICAASSRTPHGTTAIRFFNEYRVFNSLNVPVQVQQCPVGDVYRIDPGSSMSVPWLDIPHEPHRIQFRTIDSPWSKSVLCGCSVVQIFSLIISRECENGVEEGTTSSGTNMQTQENLNLAPIHSSSKQHDMESELFSTASSQLSMSADGEEDLLHSTGGAKWTWASEQLNGRGISQGARRKWSKTEVCLRVVDREQESKSLVLEKCTSSIQCSESLLHVENTTGYGVVLAPKDGPSLKLGRYSSGTLSVAWNNQGGSVLHLHLEGRGDLGLVNVDSLVPESFHRQVGRGPHKTKVTIGILREQSRRVLILSSPGCLELAQRMSKCWSPKQGLCAPLLPVPSGGGIALKAVMPQVKIAVAGVDSPLAHVSIDQIRINLLSSLAKSKFDVLDSAVTVRSIQVDNLTNSAHYSVPLAMPWPEGCAFSHSPAYFQTKGLQGGIEQDVKPTAVSNPQDMKMGSPSSGVPALNIRFVRTSGMVRLSALQLAPFSLQIEDTFVQRVCEVAGCFSSPRLTNKVEELSPEQSEVLGACVCKSCSTDPGTRQLSLECLHVAPIWMDLSFACTSKGPSIFAMSGINHAPISLPAWSFRGYPWCGSKDAINSLMQHYARAGMTELISALASASAFGDPRAGISGLGRAAFAGLFTSPLRILFAIQEWGEQLFLPWCAVFGKCQTTLLGERFKEVPNPSHLCSKVSATLSTLKEKVMNVHFWRTSLLEPPLRKVASLPQGCALTPAAILKARGIALLGGQGSRWTVELDDGGILVQLGGYLHCILPPNVPSIAAWDTASDPPSTTSSNWPAAWSVMLNTLVDVALCPQESVIYPSLEGKATMQINIIAVSDDSAEYPFVCHAIRCRTEEATKWLFDKLKASTIVYFPEMSK